MVSPLRGFVFIVANHRANALGYICANPFGVGSLHASNQQLVARSHRHPAPGTRLQPPLALEEDQLDDDDHGDGNHYAGIAEDVV